MNAIVMNHRERQRRAAEQIQKRKLDAFIVTHLPNVHYLCGFTGSAGVLACAGDKWAFFTDGRYAEQAHSEVCGARVVISKGSALAASAKWLGTLHASTLGIEADHMSVAQRSALKRMMSPKSRLREMSGLVEQLRMFKELGEVELIRKAVGLGSELLKIALSAIHPGVPEIKVAAEIEYAARKRGASAMSFETIIAGGERSALPHGVASRASVPRNGFVLMDFGVILANYCSDMTRTVHVGRISAPSRSMYNAVMEAQQFAIDSVAPGIEIGQVDAAARRVLKRANVAKYFTHSTGHGVGLEIHEQPRIAAGIREVLQPGMVITIEPGVYLPGRGGVRIEDMVLVTERGCEVLTKAPKDLLIL